jgi:hypothetical protein
MDQASQLWAWWQSLLSGFSPVFIRPGWVRFVQGVTGMVLCWEEHTLAQILTTIGLEARLRVLEHFAALPHAARLYCRRSQLPAGEMFRTRTAPPIELLCQADAESAVPILGAFYGADTVDTMVPLYLQPPKTGAASRSLSGCERTSGCITLWACSRATRGTAEVGAMNGCPQHHLFPGTSQG